MTSGVRLRPAEQVLITRARDFLAAGPADAVDLIAHVCQLPGPPRFVADHMAVALLSQWEEFSRDRDGKWRLVSFSEVGSWTVAERPLSPGTYGSAGGTTLNRAVHGPGVPPAGANDKLADLSYVVVDVETTGGRLNGGDRITEFAAVVIERGEITRVYEKLVNPQRPIPPMITALTRITWDMVKRAPTFRDIVPEVAEVLRGHVFVAHNAGFDWRFVTSEIARATGDRVEGRRLCTVRIAKKVLPQLHRRTLDWVARHYNIEIQNRHRAGGDAVATAKVFLRLLRDAREAGCTTWGELEILTRTPSRGRRKHRRRRALPHWIDRDTTA